MKKRSRILVLILTAMLSTEPVQIVYAETAEATPVWVAAEKGYQWRQEDGTLLQ